MQSLPLSHTATAPRRWRLDSIGSSAGALGGLAVLPAFPMAVLGQVLGVPAEMTVHLFLGAGTLLVAYSAFQFDLPRWLALAGFIAAAGLGLIFLLQGLTELTMSESLRSVAYGILGQWPEGVLADLVLAWLLGPLVLVSRGRTRLLGWVVMPFVLALAVLRWLPGVAIAEAIPGVLPLLLAFAWFLLASVQAPASVEQRTLD